jgi:hypothetical protein
MRSCLPRLGSRFRRQARTNRQKCISVICGARERTRAGGTIENSPPVHWREALSNTNRAPEGCLNQTGEISSIRSDTT